MLAVVLLALAVAAGALTFAALRAPAVRTVDVSAPRPASSAPATPSADVPSTSAAPDETSATVGTHTTRLDQLGGARLSPERVVIPALDVDTPVSATGLTPDLQSLALPESAAKVVWWAYGAAPGDPEGTTLIAGHISWAGRVGAFAQLGRLELGAKLSVQRSDGSDVRYRVVARRQVPKASLAGLGLFQAAGPPRLVLVTCGGEFDSSRHSYEDNVIIEAVPAA